MKTIVISAVNLVEAGTLEILRECLAYLSQLNKNGDYRIVAVVHKRTLADYPNIDYIETQWPKKRWVNRLWYEYVSMKEISKDLGEVFLWLSLHDTTPTVKAERRAVYCHNSFSFYKWKMSDWVFAPKIAAFALLTKYIYKTNIKYNDYLVVQQKWFRESMSKMFSFDEKRIIVAPPMSPQVNLPDRKEKKEPKYQFIFAGSPNSHKNFEVIARACEILEKDLGKVAFDVFITLKGKENKYAKWLHMNWGKQVSSLRFIGFISKKELFDYYEQCDAMIYPSKVESWGLPISEFKSFEKPMLLADLPYAMETAAGADAVAFFNPDNPDQLAKMMKRLIQGDRSFLEAVAKVNIEQPMAASWQELFNILLK